tara:strand:- start:278 stop:904 length:627 start_codon:yes stop_codon:yes gene_type:complete
MPLQVNKSFLKNIDVSIWHIEESEQFLISKLDLSKNCKKRLDTIKSSERRKQFLSVRNLINYNNINLNDLYYDDNGAPFLKSKKYISISHTNYFSAIALCENPVGIDIQDFRNKITSIKDKFLNDNEIKLIDVNSIKDLTIVWSIKESIYKMYQKQGLSFKKNIIIQNFSNEFKNSSVLVKDLDKKTFFSSENIIHSNYICSIVKIDE